MLNKILSFLMIGGLTVAGITENAIAQTLSLEQIQDPELSLSSIEQDAFTTSIPAIFELTLNHNNPNAKIAVFITITKPLLAEGETSEPSGTEQTAFVSFTDYFGDKQTIGSDYGNSIPAILRPGTTELTVTIETDSPVEYFGGSYSYDTTLTVDTQ